MTSRFELRRRHVLQTASAAGAAVLASPFGPRTARADDLPTLFTWEGYDVPELFGTFTAEHGTTPNFSLFAGLEEALGKLRSGFKADVTTPGAESIVQWRDSDLLEPIDTSRLSQWPDVLDGLKNKDPAIIDGVQWGVPFCWGMTSVIYRTDLVPEYADNPTWGILWDEKYAGRIAVKDGASESVVTAALMEGIANPFDMTDEQIERVRTRLEAQRPLLRFYWDDGTTLAQAIASGEVVAALGWASTFSELKKEGAPVAYMNPKEGVLTWIDLIALLKGGDASIESRYDVIDAMVTPESGAWLIDNYQVAAANRKAYDLAGPEVIESLGLTDPDAVTDRGILLRAFSPATNQKVIDMFDEVKAG